MKTPDALVILRSAATKDLLRKWWRGRSGAQDGREGERLRMTGERRKGIV
jgi:hypothetical protein